MQFGDQLGLAGLIVGLLGIGVTILWPSQRWIGYICLVLALFLACAWGILEIRYRFDNRSSPSPTVQQTEFIVSDPRSIINMKRDFFASLPFWVRYLSGYGDTISPVAVMLYVDITSGVPTPEKVKDYSVAINTSACGWVYLSPIRLRTVTVVFIPPGGILYCSPLKLDTSVR